MSFGDFNSERTNEFLLDISKPATDEEYQSLFKTISDNIFQLSMNVSAIENISNSFGTNRDSHDIRQRMHQLTESTSELAKKTNEEMKRLAGMRSSNTDENLKRDLQQSKLSRDFQLSLKRFQEVERITAQKARDYVVKARAIASKLNENDDSADQEKESLISYDKSARQEQILDSEVEFNESVILEREEGIKEIETAILEVNEIFRDLGTLVNEQQSLFDNIEANIESVAERTAAAGKELSSANKKQKSGRNLKCICVLFLTFIAAIVAIALLVGQKVI